MYHSQDKPTANIRFSIFTTQLALLTEMDRVTWVTSFCRRDDPVIKFAPRQSSFFEFYDHLHYDRVTSGHRVKPGLTGSRVRGTAGSPGHGSKKLRPSPSLVTNPNIK